MVMLRAAGCGLRAACRRLRELDAGAVHFPRGNGLLITGSPQPAARSI